MIDLFATYYAMTFNFFVKIGSYMVSLIIDNITYCVIKRWIDCHLCIETICVIFINIHGKNDCLNHI